MYGVAVGVLFVAHRRIDRPRTEGALVQSRMGARRLGPRDALGAGLVGTSGDPPPVAPVGSGVDGDENHSTGPITAALVAGLVALSIAIGKGAHNWVIAVLAFALLLGIPLAVLWIALSFKSRLGRAPWAALLGRPLQSLGDRVIFGVDNETNQGPVTRFPAR